MRRKKTSKVVPLCPILKSRLLNNWNVASAIEVDVIRRGHPRGQEEAKWKVLAWGSIIYVLPTTCETVCQIIVRTKSSLLYCRNKKKETDYRSM